MRKLIYTTNALEGFHRMLHKFTKTKTNFPTDDSLKKSIYLSIKEISKKWHHPIRNLGMIIGQFIMFYEDRFSYLALCDAPSIAYLGGKVLYHVVFKMRILSENSSVGERIGFYRRKRYLKSHTLGLQIGLSRYAIMDYENGKTEPSLEDLKKIAVVFDVEVDKFYDDYYRFLDYPYYARVKEIRTERKMTQARFGELLGVTPTTVKRWEWGKNKVSREVWEKMKALSFL